MEVPEDGVVLLADEKFDFDLSLSSSSANEDDEVFFGPIGHRERCVAASLELKELNGQIPKEPPPPPSESRLAWSPLTGEKFVEVYKEAHLLALQIQSSSKNQTAQAAKPEGPGSQGADGFIQESALKINLFEKENEAEKSPRSLKRETYCLSAGAPPGLGLGQTRGPPEPRPAPPPNQAGPQKKVTSKLPPPRALSHRGKSIPWAVEKPVKERPASLPSVKTLHDKEALATVPADRPLAAQDVSGLPASGGPVVPGKRSLPVPNKSGLKRSMFKPPGCAGGLARKPSSSSGSLSGGSSGACASPVAGKAKSGDRPSLPAGSSRPDPGQSGRTGLAVPPPALQAGPVAEARGQGQRSGPAAWTAEQPRAPSSGPLARPHTPGQGGPGLSSHLGLAPSSQTQATGGARGRGSCLTSKTKVTATPTDQFKVPKFSAGEPPGGATPRSSRAQRPQSCTAVGRVVHSTPARRSLASQSLVGSMGTPVSARRMSALPTPASRRLSSLALVTPQTMPRALASPLCMSARRLASEPQKKSAVRAAPATERQGRAASGLSDTSLDGSFSPASAVPQALSFSPEKSDFTFSKSIATEAAAALGDPRPPEAPLPEEAVLVDVQLEQLRIGPAAAGAPPGDLPLIDFCAPPEASAALRAGGGPLVDLLTNTPGAERGAAAKPPLEAGQLIDLSSPLILLSPEADKENVESPLLKF